MEGPVVILILTLFLFFSCNSMACSGCSALHDVNPNLIKKKKKDRVISYQVCIVAVNLAQRISARAIFIFELK